MEIIINVYPYCILMDSENHQVRIDKINMFGNPAIMLYYDGKMGEIIESPDFKYTVRRGYEIARDWLRAEEHWDRISWERRRREYILMIKKA